MEERKRARKEKIETRKKLLGDMDTTPRESKRTENSQISRQEEIDALECNSFNSQKPSLLIEK